METIYSDESIDVFLEEVEEIEKGVFIHTNVKQFSLSTFKKFKHIFLNICEIVKDRDIQYLLAIPPSNKEQKWQECFGFTYTGILVNKQKLMRIYL